MANGSFAQVSASEELVGGRCFLFGDPQSGICHYFVSAAFSWSSSNPSVATIDARGVLHALAAGSVTVTATDQAHNTSGTLALDVIRITTVRIAPAEILLVPGDARPFAAPALSGTDSAQTVTFAWSSSNPAVLTVDSTGLVTAIALGKAADDHTCALSTSGKAYCWGLNNQGQLGVPGTDTAVSTPEPVTGGMIFVALSAGAFGNCALTAAGDAYSWGGYIANVPALVPGGHVFRTISSGGDHACAVTALGVGYCWGSDDSGQLGIGPTNYQPSVPLRVIDPQ